MRIAVLVPAFNAERFIAETLASVLAQTRAPDQIVVVDDGSTDATASRARAVDPRVEIIGQQNRGVSAARNTGLAAIDADAVAFLDSDDLWLPTKLAAQEAFLEAHPQVSMILTDDLMFAEPASFIMPSNLSRLAFMGARATSQGEGFVLADPLRWFAESGFVTTSTVVARKTALDSCGTFDESLSIVEDRDMWIRLALRGEVGVLPEVLVHKRQAHGQNLSDIPRVKWARGLERVLTRHEEALIRRLPDVRRGRSSLLGSQFNEIGNIYWHAGMPRDARRNFVRALRHAHVPDLKRWSACFLPQAVVNLLRFFRGTRGSA